MWSCTVNRLPDFIDKRDTNFKYLSEHLSELEEYFILPRATENSQPSWFGFPLSIRDTAHFSREDLLRFLDQEQIGTRLVFAGNVTKQPYFTEIKIPHRTVGKLTNTNKVMNSSFWLGLYPGLSKAHLAKTVQKLEEFLGTNF